MYPIIVERELKSKRNYKRFSLTINFALGLQIVVAAALTALGAAKASNGAVTVFGAINTVIAGFLTFIKGSGLPNRLKYFQHEWAKLREYIEQRERDLCSPGTRIDVAEEVAVIRQSKSLQLADWCAYRSPLTREAQCTKKSEPMSR